MDKTDLYAVKAERTGFRDETISDWHRKLGHNCPCTDFDTLIHTGDEAATPEVWCEYNYEQPVALIDYKRHSYETIEITSSIRVYQNTANKLGVPFYIVGYDANYHNFRLFPQGEIAIDKIRSMARNPDTFTPKTIYHLSELHFASFLYKLRGRTLPEHLLETFHA